MYVFGLDEDVPPAVLEEALEQNGMKIAYSSKFNYYKSAPNIKNGGRSVVVDTSLEFVIPARLEILHNYFISGRVQVKLWFVGQPSFCGLCQSYGHRRDGCDGNGFPKMNSQDNIFAMKNYSNFADICSKYRPGNCSELKGVRYPEGVDQDALPHELRDSDGTPFDNLLLEKEKESESCFAEADKHDVIPFYRNHETNGNFSNLLTLKNPIDFGEHSFNSVEQGLMAFRADAAGNTIVRDQIMAEGNPFNMSKLAGDVVWPGTFISLTKFSFNALYWLNRSKYINNPSLLSDLLATKGRFVETEYGADQRVELWIGGIGPGY